MNLINWEAHSNYIRKLSHSKKRFIRRFIHHRLPTGKMQFLNRSRCPHCDTMFNNETHHDHFLTCVQTSAQKHTRLQSLTNTLNKLHTPPTLRDPIIIQIRNYYNDGLTHEDEHERNKLLLMTKSITNQLPTPTQKRTTRKNKLFKTIIQDSNDDHSPIENKTKLNPYQLSKTQTDSTNNYTSQRLERNNIFLMKKINPTPFTTSTQQRTKIKITSL